MDDITQLLERWGRGDGDAFRALMPLVYAELRKLAHHHLHHEPSNHTLQPTALIHEAFIRLSGAREARFESRAHFYGAAAHAMRRVLVDYTGWFVSVNASIAALLRPILKTNNVFNVVPSGSFFWSPTP